MTKSEQKNIIKKRLWNAGYKVRDMGHVYRKEPFDLLIEGKYKVVLDSAPTKKTIRAVLSQDGEVTYEYYKSAIGTFAHTRSHMIAFGRPASRS